MIERPVQGALPDKTQHPQDTDINAPSETRTRSRSKRATAEAHTQTQTARPLGLATQFHAVYFCPYRQILQLIRKYTTASNIVIVTVNWKIHDTIICYNCK
jgi:hypothetical protein